MCECLTYAEGGRYYCEACEDEVKDLEDVLIRCVAAHCLQRGGLHSDGHRYFADALHLLAVRNRVKLSYDDGDEAVAAEEIKADE